MSAVVRVKRRIDEEPLSAFVLNGKRRRLEENSDTTLPTTSKDELSTVVKFACTIKEQDDTATALYARLTNEEAKEMVLQKSQKPRNVTNEIHQELVRHRHEQRFCVVNCLRTTWKKDNSINEKSKRVTIVDTEKQSTYDKTADDEKDIIHIINEVSTSAADAAALADILTTPTSYGYEISTSIISNAQYADNVDFMDDNPFNDLSYEDSYNNDEDNEYDSEDSNQENYYKTEYPDEDDQEYDADVNEEDEDNDISW